jgi:hypothetical protein
MKKILYCLIALYAFIGSAQKSKKEEGIVFGIKGGLNVSNFIGDVKDNTFRTSVHVGIFSEIMISEKFSLQPEVLYSGQGYSGQTDPGFSRSKYDYVNIPVLGKIYVAERISVEAGPQIGFLLSAKRKTELDKVNIPNQKTVDLGLNIGLAYDLKNKIFFQTRYNIGLSNINSGDNANAEKYTNSVIQFSVGVPF